MDFEEAERMLEAIEKEYKEQDMDERTYHKLKDKYQSMVEEKRETPEKGSIGEVVSDGFEEETRSLISEVKSSRENIEVLKTKKDSAVDLLKDLEEKREKKQISEEKFENLSEEHESEMEEVEKEIQKNKERIEEGLRDLEVIGEELRKKIKDWEDLLERIEQVKDES